MVEATLNNFLRRLQLTYEWIFFVAAPTGSMKKVWDEITPDEVRDMFSAVPCQIKAIVQNGVRYIE